MNTEPTDENTEERPLKKQISKYVDNDCYACPECDSLIKILYIDENKMKIYFKCYKDVDHNKIKKPMLIKDFLSSCEKNTYLYEKCSKCGKVQNEETDKLLFNYCKECNEIICENCNNNHQHELIKNNQRYNKCINHPKNYHIYYCFKCQTHCCNECYKIKSHRGHIKDIINDVLPSDDQKNEITNSIECLKKEQNQLEEKKIQYIKEKDNELENNINKISEKYKIQKNNYTKKKEKKEIFLRTKLKEEIKELEKKFVNEVKKLKRKYKNLIDSFKSNTNIYEKNNKKNEENEKSEIKEKINKEKDSYMKEFDKNYKNKGYLIKIKEKVKNSFENYQHNYFYCTSFLNVADNKKENIS